MLNVHSCKRVFVEVTKMCPERIDDQTTGSCKHIETQALYDMSLRPSKTPPQNRGICTLCHGSALLFLTTILLFLPYDAGLSVDLAEHL